MKRRIPLSIMFGLIITAAVLCTAAHTQTLASVPSSVTPQLLTGLVGVAPGQSARLSVVNITGNGVPGEPVYAGLYILDNLGNVLASLPPLEPVLPGQSATVEWMNSEMDGTARIYVRSVVTFSPSPTFSISPLIPTDPGSIVKGTFEVVDTTGSTSVLFLTSSWWPSDPAVPTSPVYPLVFGLTGITAEQSLVLSLFNPGPAPTPTAPCHAGVTWVDAQGNAIYTPGSTLESELGPISPLGSQIFAVTPGVAGLFRPVVHETCGETVVTPSLGLVPVLQVVDNVTGKSLFLFPVNPIYPSGPWFPPDPESVN